MVDEIHARVVNADGEQTTVQTLHNHTTGLLDVLRNIDNTGTYRPPVEGEIAEPVPLDGRDLPLDHRLGVYDNIVRTAWSDGVVTKDEQVMLDDMAIYLGLEPHDTEPIEKRVREESVDPDAQNS